MPPQQDRLVQRQQLCSNQRDLCERGDKNLDSFVDCETAKNESLARTIYIYGGSSRSAHDDNRLLAGGRRSDDIESGSNWADVFALPPLPIPDYSTMRSEACYGNFLVLALIVFFVTPVHMGYTNDTIFYLYLIYAEAVIAIICLLGLMWGDPGTIKRTPETCFPLPAQVSAQLCWKRLDAGRLGNIHEAAARLHSLPRLEA